MYLTAKEFISLVANGKNEKAGLPPTGATVKTLIAEKTAQLKDVKLTLIIDGIEKHFRNVKTLQNREYRQVREMLGFLGGGGGGCVGSLKLTELRLDYSKDMAPTFCLDRTARRRTEDGNDRSLDRCKSFGLRRE